MTIRQALALYPGVEADLLLAHILKQDREFLYLHDEKVLTSTQVRKFKLMVRQRLRGVPLAYIRGYKNFYGLRFAVNKQVLIPRPESEWLVDRAVEFLKDRSRARVLDVGTGSGCLIISIAKHVPKKRYILSGSDISTAALTVAGRNARMHKEKIKFFSSDLLENARGPHDLIIANLPYVPLRDYKKLHAGLKYEPFIALTDNTNTGRIYEKFLQQLKTRTQPGSLILLEMDPTNVYTIKKAVAKFLPNATVTFHKDIKKMDRYAKIKITA